MKNFAALYERPLPHSAESEMCLVGAMMLDPKVIPDVTALVGEGSFYSERYAAVFASIMRVYSADPDLSLDAVVNDLRHAGKLELVGGTDGLGSMIEPVASGTMAFGFARTVADYARLRGLLGAADKIAYSVLNHGPLTTNPVQGTVDHAEAAVFEIAQQGRTVRQTETMGELMQAELEAMQSRDGGSRGVATGLIDLDKITLGLQNGEMIVIAARPSMGKTALAACLCLGAAKAGTPVAFFSLEMGRAAIAQRFLSLDAGVDSQSVRTGVVGEDGMRKLSDAAERFRREYATIHVQDTAGMSIFVLRADARRMVSRHKVGLIVVDYLQLMSAPESSRDGRTVEVSAISRGVKALARETNVPVVVLSQLNRASEQREGHRPRMSDLRESGAIEQDADVVMLLHREEYYHQGDESWDGERNVAELIVAKQRNGPVGSVRLSWSPSLTRFSNYAPSEIGVSGGAPW